MNYRFDCQHCPSPCDGISKANYIFENDADYSERKENFIIDCINQQEGYSAKKCDLQGYPDIEVRYGDDVFYIEIKAQRRTFMSVKRLLPNAELIPSETMVLNLSDLVRYFDIEKSSGRNVYLMWCLENRPCIVKQGETKYFYQSAKALQDIYHHYLDKRRFKRKSGNGDVVNGQHKGVVLNYHFSLAEMKEATAKNRFTEILTEEEGRTL